MAVLPYSTVFIKLYLNTHLYNHFIQRGCFFSLHYCSLELLGPGFQNGADHLREIRMSLNCRVSEVFLVFATQAKVTSEATWFPKCRWLAAGDRRIYIQFGMLGLCAVSQLQHLLHNIIVQHLKHLFSTSFLFYFLTPWSQGMSQISTTELNPVGHICHLNLFICDNVPCVIYLFHLLIKLEFSLLTACSAQLKSNPENPWRSVGRGWPEEALELALYLFLGNYFVTFTLD